MPNLQGAVNAGCNLRNGESLPLFLVLVFRLGCARLPITAATSSWARCGHLVVGVRFGYVRQSCSAVARHTPSIHAGS